MSLSVDIRDHLLNFGHRLLFLLWKCIVVAGFIGPNDPRARVLSLKRPHDFGYHEPIFR